MTVSLYGLKNKQGTLINIGEADMPALFKTIQEAEEAMEHQEEECTVVTVTLTY